METELRPIDDANREAVLALSVREDQPFVAPNDVSLRQAAETNEKYPGVARPFGIYADDKLVGFCMFAFAPQAEDEDDRYWLWRFMIDKSEQDKGYGQAALAEIVRYFKTNGADRLYLSTEPENERGLHIYHKAGFRETGVIEDGEAVLMRTLKGPNRIVKNFYGVDVDKAMRIKGRKGYGVSIAVYDSDGLRIEAHVRPDPPSLRGQGEDRPGRGYLRRGAGIRQKGPVDLHRAAIPHGGVQRPRLPGLSGRP